MKKIIIILLPIFFILVIIIVIAMRGSNKNNTIQFYPTPTPITVSNPQNQQPQTPKDNIKSETGSYQKVLDKIDNKQPISQIDVQAKNQINSSLNNSSGSPITTDEYRVDYLHDNDIFVVEILTTDIQKAKSDAVDWFKSQGFTQDGICKLPVTFYINFDVKQKLPPGTVFNPLPNSC